MTTLKTAARETNIYFDVSLIFKPIKHNQRFCMSRTYVRQEKWPKKKIHVYSFISKHNKVLLTIFVVFVFIKASR